MTCLIVFDRRPTYVCPELDTYSPQGLDGFLPWTDISWTYLHSRCRGVSKALSMPANKQSVQSQESILFMRRTCQNTGVI
jgi:hypothetical protein